MNKLRTYDVIFEGNSNKINTPIYFNKGNQTTKDTFACLLVFQHGKLADFVQTLLLSCVYKQSIKIFGHTEGMQVIIDENYITFIEGSFPSNLALHKIVAIY